MAKKVSLKKNDSGMKKTALVRIRDVVLFIAFDDKKVSGTCTSPDGSTRTFESELKEV